MVAFTLIGFVHGGIKANGELEDPHRVGQREVV